MKSCAFNAPFPGAGLNDGRLTMLVVGCLIIRLRCDSLGTWLEVAGGEDGLGVVPERSR